MTTRTSVEVPETVRRDERFAPGIEGTAGGERVELTARTEDATASRDLPARRRRRRPRRDGPRRGRLRPRRPASDDQGLASGSDPADHARARRDAWPQVLEWFETALR